MSRIGDIMKGKTKDKKEHSYWERQKTENQFKREQALGFEAQAHHNPNSKVMKSTKAMASEYTNSQLVYALSCGNRKSKRLAKKLLRRKRKGVK